MASKPEAEAVRQKTLDLIVDGFGYHNITQGQTFEEPGSITHRQFSLTIRYDDACYSLAPHTDTNSEREFEEQKLKGTLAKCNTRLTKAPAQDALRTKRASLRLLDDPPPLQSQDSRREHTFDTSQPQYNCDTKANTSHTAVQAGQIPGMLAIPCEHSWSETCSEFCYLRTITQSNAMTTQPPPPVDDSVFIPRSPSPSYIEFSENCHKNITAEVSNAVMPAIAPTSQGGEIQQADPDTFDDFSSSYSGFETVGSSTVSYGRLVYVVPESAIDYYG
jgi:hypothetical protein